MISYARPTKAVLRASLEPVQYTSNDYLEFCQRHQLRPSVGRTGVCWDNAVAESFWESLKRECLQERVFATRAEAPRAIFRLDQLVQQIPAPHQPPRRSTYRMGTAVPSSVINTVRPTGRFPVL